MSLETMTKISSTTVGAGGSSTITFAGVPQDYTDLRITLSARGTENNYYTNFLMYFNGGGTSDYTFIRGIGINSGVSSDGPFTSQSVIYIGEANAATSTSSSFCHFDIHIGNYTEPRFKGVSIDKSQTNNSTSAYILGVTGAGWLNTAPITTITLSNTSGLFAQYSTATLYGIKNQTKVIGNSVKATGGAIAFDGTYVTHTFNSTDTFTPTTNLVADLLVVGGGGSGGTAGGVTAGGGGGAGGVSYQPNAQLIFGSSYPVTIGAGGAGGATGYTAGPDGSNSTFSTFTGFGGGGGGAGYTGTQGIANGRSGGSGGGGGSLSTTSTGTGGSATQTTSGTNIGYGNAGGIGRHSAGSYVAAGGGGGAGEAGVGATAVSPSIGGRGGDGTTAFSTWKIGQLVSGTYYLAGGGGGCGGGSGGDNPRGGYGGGAAGGNQGSATQATNAIVNTGGGGGGGPVYTGAGGSGVVVIRYKA